MLADDGSVEPEQPTFYSRVLASVSAMRPPAHMEHSMACAFFWSVHLVDVDRGYDDSKVPSPDKSKVKNGGGRQDGCECGSFLFLMVGDPESGAPGTQR